MYVAQQNILLDVDKALVRSTLPEFLRENFALFSGFCESSSSLRMT